MKMLANWILVRPEPWTTKKLGSIILPDSSREHYGRGVVVAKGPGVWLHSGCQIPIEMEVGDHILYFKQAAIEITYKETLMHTIVEKEVLAILKPGDFGELDKHDVEETEGETTDATDN